MSLTCAYDGGSGAPRRIILSPFSLRIYHHLIRQTSGYFHPFWQVRFSERFLDSRNTGSRGVFSPLSSIALKLYQRKGGIKVRTTGRRRSFCGCTSLFPRSSSHKHLGKKTERHEFVEATFFVTKGALLGFPLFSLPSQAFRRDGNDLSQSSLQLFAPRDQVRRLRFAIKSTPVFPSSSADLYKIAPVAFSSHRRDSKVASTPKMSKLHKDGIKRSLFGVS